MEKFKKLMEEKRKSKGSMDNVEKAARGSVLHDMIGALDQEGSDKVKNLKKVTVASNDSKGLESGLDKAKEIIHQGEDEVEGGDESENDLLKHELAESPEYDDEEGEEAQDDMPVKHVHEAEHNDSMSMHAPDKEEEAEMVEGSPEHIAHLKAIIEDYKAHIAHLQKPKSFY